MKIIAVDWDPGALLLLYEYLTDLLPQAQIDTFTDPFWAVKHAYNHQVDMVFTGTGMRGLSGSDVIRLVRGHQAGFVPAFYVTESEQEYEKEFRQTRADGFLRKPVAKETLKTLVTEVLKDFIPGGKRNEGVD